MGPAGKPPASGYLLNDQSDPSGTPLPTLSADSADPYDNASILPPAAQFSPGAFDVTPGTAFARADSGTQPTDTSALTAETAAAGSHTVTIGSAGGLEFQLTFDSSDQNVPANHGGQAAFENAIEAAAQAFVNLYDDPITLAIDVGWTEIDGETVPGGDGESEANDTTYTYNQILQKLTADAKSSTDQTALAHLNGDPGSGGHDFAISNANAKALGLTISQSSDGFDGYVGFGSQTNPQDSSFLGVAEHELSEVMGRVGVTDDGEVDNNGNPLFTVLDLFRYYNGPPATWSPDDGVGPSGQTTFFSIDGGKTVVNTFSNVQGDDFGADWLFTQNTPADAFNAIYTPGVAQPLTAGDILVMDALGYDLTTATAPTVSSTTANPSSGDLGTGAAVTVTVAMSKAVTVSGGTPTLTLNDNGSATYNASASTSTALVFDYTVARGQNTSALAVTGTSLNGATIKDSSGNSANLSGADVTFTGLQIDTAATTVPNDFNGNGISDVLWHNNGSGDTGYWITNAGGTVTGFHDFGAEDSSYAVAGTADFNGDGNLDILFHNATNGDTGYWAINSSGAVTGFHDLGSEGTSNAIAGIGEFDSTGAPEILFHNSTTGDTGYWTTNSTGAVTGFHDYGDGNTAYSIAGVADFNGDGISDILWHNGTGGDTGYWTTNSAGAVTGFHDFANANTAYQIAGIGEFDSSGTPEILFHNSTNGDTGYWTTNSSGTVTGFHDFGDGNTAYSIAAIGDYNGDGISDILWHNNTTGDTGYWLINASGAVTGFHDFAAGNTAYTIVK